MQAKKIDVDKHVQKYESVDMSYIAAFIKKLEELVERKRREKLDLLKRQVEILESGEQIEQLAIHEIETQNSSSLPKTNRRKKKKETEEEIVEE